MKNVTKWQLFNALITGGPLGDQLLVVERVEREDGSGHCFNVTGHAANWVVTKECPANGPRWLTVFVRTID